MEKSSTILLEGRQDCREAAKILLLGALERVYIISQRLEPELYNDAEIYEHLRGLTAANRNADIRILALDTRAAANQGHFLIHLAQKLPSFVQIRTPVTREHRNFRESWLVADDCAYLRLRNPDRFKGYYEIDNKLECKSYIDEFNEIWEASEPDQNTRRLSL